MEKIILFLIIFGIGSLYEYVKELNRKKARSEGNHTDAPRQSQRQRSPFGMRFPEMPAMPSALRETPHPVYQPIVTEETGEEMSAFLPGEQISVARPEAQTAMSQGAEPSSELKEESRIGSIADASQTDAELQAHYSHWRQAIIEAEIIQRKF